VAIAVYLVRGRIDEPPAVTADREELEKAAAEGDLEAKQALEDDPLGAAPEEGLMGARLPFGPFLILGIFEYLFFGEWLRDVYEAWVRGG
jgi:prepilin signal peptidase PulO-like enzyme (type II secretory pathway)